MNKPTTNPIRKATGDNGNRFELHLASDGRLELWAHYGEWIEVGTVANKDNMEVAIASHEEELRYMVAGL